MAREGLEQSPPRARDSGSLSGAAYDENPGSSDPVEVLNVVALQMCGHAMDQLHPLRAASAALPALEECVHAQDGRIRELSARLERASRDLAERDVQLQGLQQSLSELTQKAQDEACVASAALVEARRQLCDKEQDMRALKERCESQLIELVARHRRELDDLQLRSQQDLFISQMQPFQVNDLDRSTAASVLRQAPGSEGEDEASTSVGTGTLSADKACGSK